MLAAPVNDACGVDPSSICRRVFGWTDSANTAETVDWLTHKPLRLALRKTWGIIKESCNFDV